MDKVAERAVIQYLHKKGLAPKVIHANMEAAMGKDIPTLKRLVAEFKRGRDSLEDDTRAGKPATVATPEIVTSVHDMVMGDRLVTERHIHHENTPI